MVGGDIYCGLLRLDQNLLWRPRPGLPGHGTPIDGLYHIGASTHPGPGLGAGSGTLVAKHLLPPLPKRRSAAWIASGARLTLDKTCFRVAASRAARHLDPTRR